MTIECRLWLTASRLLELTVLSLLVWWLGRKWFEDFGFVHGSMSGIFRPKKMNVSTSMSVISLYVATSVNFWKQLPFIYCCWVKGNGISDSVDNCLRQKASVGIQEGKHGFWLDLCRTPWQLIGSYWTPCFCVQWHIKIAGVDGLEPNSGTFGMSTCDIGWLISLRELDAKQGSESFGWRCFLEVLSLAKQNQTAQCADMCRELWQCHFCPCSCYKEESKERVCLALGSMLRWFVCVANFRQFWIFATFTVPRSPVGSCKQFDLCFSWGQKTQPWEQGCCSMVWSWSLMWRFCIQTQQERPWIVEYWRDEKSRI